MLKKIIVIKVGSAVISDAAGDINSATIKKLSQDIHHLSRSHHVALVSSGAVSSGKKYLSNYKGSLSDRKAAAAIGNPVLIQLYHKQFKKHGIHVAQALCERRHFSDRKQFLQLKDTFSNFWDNGVLPIVNENDLVSDFELKFSDNDELATLIAIGFGAELLMICTSVGGFLNPHNQIIPLIENVDSNILSYVSSEKSAVGLGGMSSKLTFTKLATSLGIGVIFCGISAKNNIRLALDKKCGTWFLPKKSDLKARQKWLASGSITLGTITVDKGAMKALQNRKSLLAIGIVSVAGSFYAGEVIQLSDDEGNIFGVAKSKADADTLQSCIKLKNFVAAHADDIVLL